MGFWDKFLKIDRRWLFLLVFIVVLIPLIKPLRLPTFITKPSQDLYNYIDNIEPHNKAVLLVSDFDPSTMPELLPMAEAIIRHCFAKHIKLIVYGGLVPQFVGMAVMAIQHVLPDFPDVKYGEDYVLLGYIPGGGVVILSIGEGIKETFKKDYYGHPLDSLPMMKDIHNYDDIALSIDLSGSGSPYWWVMFAYQKYGEKIGCGTTAVSAAQYYPLLQTGQFVGMLGGLKGAAEYEHLIKKAGIPTGRMVASMGMDAQSIIHLLIILLVILGNIGYFIVRRGGGR